jgi:hypothetical protein
MTVECEREGKEGRGRRGKEMEYGEECGSFLGEGRLAGESCFIKIGVGIVCISGGF